MRLLPEFKCQLCLFLLHFLSLYYFCCALKQKSKRNLLVSITHGVTQISAFPSEIRGVPRSNKGIKLFRQLDKSLNPILSVYALSLLHFWRIIYLALQTSKSMPPRTHPLPETSCNIKTKQLKSKIRQPRSPQSLCRLASPVFFFFFPYKILSTSLTPSYRLYSLVNWSNYLLT